MGQDSRDRGGDKETMNKESEKVIEAHLRDECVKRGWLCLKMRPYEIGYPDRLVVLTNESVAWVELKTTGCKATPMQRKRIEKLRAMGHRVWIADSKTKVDKIIEELCHTRTERTCSDGRENMPDGQMSE